MRGMTDESVTNLYFDYSGGRENAPTLTVMVGPAGSGKSTVARSVVNWHAGGTVRVNRDTLRAMLYCGSPWNNAKEQVIRRLEEESVRLLLSMGVDVIVDDTNCSARTRHKLEQIARASRARFHLEIMNTDKKECLRRNALRGGGERVPDEAVEQHFKRLAAGAPVVPAGYALGSENRAADDWEDLLEGTLLLRLPDAGIVVCDIDGTAADAEGIRDPFDETRVLLDRPREGVARWLRGLYPSYNILLFSGRHSSVYVKADGQEQEVNVCKDTCDWFEAYGIPFDHILMRPEGSSASDHIVKQRKLDALLRVFPRERIAFAIDDRWKIVEQVWRANGVKVYPVGGTPVHGEGCTFRPDKRGWRHCPQCGALEDF